MTVKEIADVFDVHVDTVSKHVRELFPDSVQKGKRTDLSEEQVAILSVHMKSKAHIGRPSSITEKLTSENFSEAIIGVALPEASLEPELRLLRAKEEMQAAYEAVIAKLRTALDVKTKELDQAKEWYSVKRVAIETGTMYPWGPLKDYSIENGYDIHKAFDANYKSCNLYHIDVWYAVYGVEL